MVVYRISGAFFFGAAASIGAVLERIGDAHRNLIIDFTAVPFVDSTGARTIEGLAHKAAERGVGVYLTGDFTACFAAGDNTGLLATDTMKNTVYAVARTSTATTMEAFALELAEFLAALTSPDRPRQLKLIHNAPCHHKEPGRHPPCSKRNKIHRGRNQVKQRLKTQ